MNKSTQARGNALPRNRAERNHPELVEPDLISVPETAKRLGVSTETIYRQIRAGNFPPAVHIGRKVKVSVPKLNRYLHGEAGAA